MIVMTFTIELDIGLSFLLQSAPPLANDRSTSDRLKRLACEMWRAASSAMAQRLWLTTSTLCRSGSRTNAP